MEKNKVIYCDTKKNENDTAVRTKLTLDLAGLTDEDVLEYAYDAMVIKWQSAARRNAKKNNVRIPAETTYVVPKPGTRGAVGISREQALKKVIADMGGDYDKILEAAGSFDALWNKFSAFMAEYKTPENAADELIEEQE